MPSKMPLHLVWALTNACNVRCIHCCAASARRSSNELSHDEILSQIDVLARDGLLDLALSGGEPLLIKRLENIVGARGGWEWWGVGGGGGGGGGKPRNEQRALQVPAYQEYKYH